MGCVGIIDGTFSSIDVTEKKNFFLKKNIFLKKKKKKLSLNEIFFFNFFYSCANFVIFFSGRPRSGFGT